MIGLGAVGLRSATLLQKEGCEVTVAPLPPTCSATIASIAARAASTVAKELGLDVREPADRGRARGGPRGAQIVLSAGPAGVQVLRRDFWAEHPTLELLADYNAAEPLGVEGTEATDDIADYDGKLVLGALAIGGPKMKVHKTCVRRLFESNDQILDTDAVYEIAKELLVWPACRGRRPGDGLVRRLRARRRRGRSSSGASARSTWAPIRRCWSRRSWTHGPFELVLGPAGYGLPLVPVEQVGERELALMLLLREDEPHGRVGVGGMRSIVRALIAAGLPLVFGPGAIHLPTIPAYRKWNRIDLGTADKVASVALCIADQARRLGVDFAETSFVMLELGGAFSAALAVDGGRIVDGLGGSAGPIGARACGALDAEAAYLLGAALSKETVFSGGALAAGGRSLGGAGRAAARPASSRGLARAGGGRGQGRARADRQRAGSARDPPRGAPGEAPGMVDALGARLAHVAPVRIAEGLAAAQGAAVLADGLAGGRYAALVERLGVRDASGSALDHLRVHGADRIRLR